MNSHERVLTSLAPGKRDRGLIDLGDAAVWIIRSPE